MKKSMYIDDDELMNLKFSKEGVRFPKKGYFGIHLKEVEETSWEAMVERLRQYPENKTGNRLVYYPPGFKG